MREPILVGSSPCSSSNFLPLTNNPKHKPYFLHPTPKTFTAKISSSSSSSNSTSTTTTATSTSSAPLLMNVHQDIRGNNRLKYYADLASKLVEDGRLEDFLMIIESVLGLGIEPTLFVNVVEVLSKVEKLGISSVSLFDKSVKKSIGLECRRLVNVGKLNDVVDTIVALSGFKFPIKDLVDPFEIIKLCVKKNEPNMVVRYACLLPQAQILYTLAIQDFGKKRDLVSALIAYEASERNGPNMYAWRSIIDVCGLRGDFLKSRQIYEELLAQKVTPNSYVCNSLMNVNAHDLSYILDVYKQMQTIGVAVDMASYNILLKACCLAGRVDLARDIYKEVRHKASTGTLKLDVITYSTIIKGLNSMRDAGIKPDVIAYTTAIKACVANKNLSLAFTLFEEMKKYQLQPNLVTYNTLLRARNRYGSAFEVQQCLAIYQDMQKAGYAGDFTSPNRSSVYSSNDSYLKELIEEWCEGVIQGRNQNQEILGQNGSRNKTAVDKPHSRLFEKVATHLQKDITETRAVDIRGLTMVEARIVVLAVLRMIKESYAQGNPVKDDLIIILGVGEGIATGSGSESEVRDSIVKLLQDELSLTVLSSGPRFSVPSSNDQGNPLNADPIHENLENNNNFESPARRPVVLRRLKITRKSLYNWLQKKSSRMYTKSS
ncbi:hypothetical protein MKX01_008930 [Papaver californicum]|nr:hypothetical protein MKX01_008930 [Papaver californicum]